MTEGEEVVVSDSEVDTHSRAETATSRRTYMSLLAVVPFVGTAVGTAAGDSRTHYDTTNTGAYGEGGYGLGPYGGTSGGTPPLCTYADDGSITIAGLRDAINDWAGGGIDIGLLRDVIDAWASGDEVDC